MESSTKLIGAHKTDNNNFYFFFESRIGEIVNYQQMLVRNIQGAEDIYMGTARMTPLEFLAKSCNVSIPDSKSKIDSVWYK